MHFFAHQSLATLILGLELMVQKAFSLDIIGREYVIKPLVFAVCCLGGRGRGRARGAGGEGEQVGSFQVNNVFASNGKLFG